MLELYRLTLFAGFIAQKKNIGSKRWLKTWRSWNLQPHNIASLYKASILFHRTVYKRAMPQSPAAAIVWFQTGKNKNTKQSNQKTNMNKNAFCGVDRHSISNATWHTKGCHNFIYRGLLHLRDRRKLLPFWDVVGTFMKSILTKYHTMKTTFIGSRPACPEKGAESHSSKTLAFSSSVITNRRSAVPYFSLAT